MKILCFGNLHVPADSLAHLLADSLSGKLCGFEFIKCNSYDDLVLHENEDFIILDVAEGLRTPKWLKRSELRDYKRYSSHDLDLSFYLKLLKPKCRIFALPKGMKKAEAIKTVKKELKAISLPKEGAGSTWKGAAGMARRKRNRGEKC